MRKAKAESNTPTPISRQAVEAQIELLIDILNALDPDPDLEPSLGWTQPAGHPLETPADLLRNANAGDDREDDDEREPHEDNENSLGWTDAPKQSGLAWQGHPYYQADLEEGAGPVRRKRPVSKTGCNVYRGCGVLV